MTKTPATAAAAAPAPAATADLLALGFAPINAKPTPAAKPATARDYVKAVDLAIIIAAGDAVAALVPEDLRETVAQLVANQLHHLSTPKQGWPSATLPTPDRSDWR